MSLQEIEKRIMAEAEEEAAQIKREADNTIAQLDKFHAQKKEEIRAEILQQARQKAEDITRSHLIPARLAAKKALLSTKRGIMEKIYADIQKEQQLSLAETEKLKEDTEIKIAEILYG